VATLAAAAGVYPRIFSLGRPGVNDYDSTTTTFLFVRNAGGQNIMVGRSGGTNYVTVNIPAYSTPFLAQSGHDVNLTTIGLNGVLAPSPFNTGITTNFNITSYGIGTNTNTADVHSLIGLVGEIIYYTENLTTAQIQQVEGYLAWKWGLQANLPVGHPFKYNPTTMRVFQPSDVDGLQVWLDAADTSVFTLSGSNVTQWRDKSGNARHFNPLNIARTPILYNGFNGRPTVESPAAPNIATVLNSPTIASSNIQGATGFSFFMVSRVISGVVFVQYEFPRIISLEGSNRFDYGQSNVIYNYPAGFTNTSNNILNLNHTSSTSTIALSYNGSIISNYSVNNVTSQYSGIIALFGIRDGNLPAFGQISEFIIYNRSLLLSERQQLEGYLTDKWRVAALPTTHPFNLQRALPSTPIFAPALVSNILIWLDAQDPAGTGVRPGNGSTVTTWVDKSGTPNNMTATGTVTYQDSPSRLVMSSSSMSATFSYGANTLFIVYNQTGATGPVFTTNNEGVSGLFPNEVGTTFFARSDAEWIGPPFPASTIPQNTINLISVQYAGTASSSAMNLWRNGVLNLSSTTSGTITRNRLTLAVRSSNNQFMAGNYHEVILYNRSLTENERQRVEGYLAWKWGLQTSLPTTHPYYKFRP
jgi:hypothetical protein